MDTVILLHGWGETAGMWAPLEQAVGGVSWVVPAAPVAPPVAGGHDTPPWYDVESGVENGERFHRAVPQLYLEAVGGVMRQIEAVVEAGTPAHRIVVGGFCQGGSVVAAVLLLLRDVRLGGVFLIGGSLAALPTLRAYVEHRGGAAALANRSTPVMCMRGGADSTYTDEQAGVYREYLVNELGFTCWHHRVVPEVAHRVSPEMLREVAVFIRSCLE